MIFMRKTTNNILILHFPLIHQHFWNPLQHFWNLLPRFWTLVVGPAGIYSGLQKKALILLALKGQKVLQTWLKNIQGVQ